MTTPEIQRLDNDVFDPAGGDRLYITGRNLTTPSNVLVGVTPATSVKEIAAVPDYDGVDDRLQAPSNISSFASTSAFSGWALVRVRSSNSDSVNGYNNNVIFGADTGYVALYVRSSGVIGFYMWDGADKQVQTPFAFNVLSLVQWDFDGVNIRIRVNGGTWASTPCGASSFSTQVLYFGRNYVGSLFLDGVEIEAGLTNTVLSATNHDNVIAYVNNRYGTNFGGIASSAFDPATLALTGWWRSGGYVSGTWTGVASAGTSGGRNLTEATNPPAVAPSSIVCAMPAKTAGKYPLSVVAAAGTGTLANGIEYANPKTIPNCIWWLRPDVGITQAGGTVSAWADQSAAADANRNATLPGGAVQPAWNASNRTFQGKPTVDWAGVALTRLATAYWTGGPIAQPHTVGSVFLTTDDAAGGYLFDDNDGTLRVAQVAGAGSSFYYAGAGTPLLNVSKNVVHSLADVFNGASSVGYVDAIPGVTGSPGTDGIKSMCLGNSPNNSNTAAVTLRGSIAEVYAYSRALTLREVRTLRRYRDSYYGAVA